MLRFFIFNIICRQTVSPYITDLVDKHFYFCNTGKCSIYIAMSTYHFVEFELVHLESKARHLHYWRNVHWWHIVCMASCLLSLWFRSLCSAHPQSVPRRPPDARQRHIGPVCHHVLGRVQDPTWPWWWCQFDCWPPGSLQYQWELKTAIWCVPEVHILNR